VQIGGVNVKVVQERLGHHSHSFTADTYQHVIPGMDEAAATKFDALVFGETDANAPSTDRRAAETP
jgi:integrase